eukprot:GHVU01208973.1.p1 GENE.GHVU01208973.1~~GHVU01208973.1.p1  ORF type:complete len:109 (+),score=4.18 GHVU01208973.1:22-327(+)
MTNRRCISRDSIGVGRRCKTLARRVGYKLLLHVCAHIGIHWHMVGGTGFSFATATDVSTPLDAPTGAHTAQTLLTAFRSLQYTGTHKVHMCAETNFEVAHI